MMIGSDDSLQEKSSARLVQRLAWAGMVVAFLFWLVSPGIPPKWLNPNRVEALIAMALLWNVGRLHNWARRACFVLWLVEWPMVILYGVILVKGMALGATPFSQPGPALYEALWVVHYGFNISFFSYLFFPKVRSIFIQSPVKRWGRIFYFVSFIAAMGATAIWLGSSAVINKAEDGQRGGASLNLQLPDGVINLVNKVIGLFTGPPR